MHKNDIICLFLVQSKYVHLISLVACKHAAKKVRRTQSLTYKTNMHHNINNIKCATLALSMLASKQILLSAVVTAFGHILGMCVLTM